MQQNRWWTVEDYSNFNLLNVGYFDLICFFEWYQKACFWVDVIDVSASRRAAYSRDEQKTEELIHHHVVLPRKATMNSFVSVVADISVRLPEKRSSIS